MVVISIEEYSRLTNNIEDALDAADLQAATDPKRLTHDVLFSSLRGNRDE